ncbi:MAG: AAA family ATPase [Candidatus Brocadiia bacterium]
MYLEHFGLTSFPFNTAPDPRFYYPSAKHREALACLLYVIEQHKGFALITGEIGAGKTMLCRATLERLDESVDAAVIVNTTLSPLEFLQAVAVEFGVDIEGAGKIALLKALQSNLAERHGAGRNSVLIVDEAQDLSIEVLEELRLLGNMETSVDKLLQIILLGQPELRRMIGRPELRALDQRMAVKFHLGTLGREDVHAYVEHRLELAGAGEGGIFESEAREAVFEASGGVPRVINVICDQALLQAYSQGRERVDRETLRQVVAEMEGYYMDEKREAAVSGGPLPSARVGEGVPDDAAPAGHVQDVEQPTNAAEGSPCEFADFGALRRALHADQLSVTPSADEGESQAAQYDHEGRRVSVLLRNEGAGVGLTLRVPLEGLVTVDEAELRLAAAERYEKIGQGSYVHRNEMDLRLRIGDERVALSAPARDDKGPMAVPGRLERMNDELVALLDLLRSRVAEADGSEEPGTEVAEARLLPRVVSRSGSVVTLECPRCESTVRVYEDEVGESGKCPGCSATIYVAEEAFRPEERAHKASADADPVPKPERKGFKWLRMFPCLRGIAKYSPFG